MFLPSGIVLIDNEKIHLELLRDAFFRAGIPCLPMHYISDDPDNKTGIDQINLSNDIKIRILFLDLNLNNYQQLDPVNLAGPIANVIKKLKPSGPYILVFWSMYQSECEKVIGILEERFVNDISLPMSWSSLDKTEYMGSQDSKHLSKSIISILKSQTLFSSLIAWEGRVSVAAHDTLNCLCELATPNEAYSLENHKREISKLLTAIAHETIGIENAQSRPAFAVEQGLFPVLIDRLSQITEESDIDTIWRTSLQNLGNKISLDNKIAADLNSFFNIDLVRTGLTKKTRGVFVSLNQDSRIKRPQMPLRKIKLLQYFYNMERLPHLIRNNKLILRLFKKPSNSKYSNDLLREYIGKSRLEILEDFLNKDSRKAERYFIKNAFDNTMLGLLEIGAACDHAQKKIEHYRYVLGALIPEEYEKLVSFNSGRGKHDGIYIFPDIMLNSKRFLLRLNFKYQVGLPEASKFLGNPLFRVREQILSDIIFRYAQYSSRPGFVKF